MDPQDEAFDQPVQLLKPSHTQGDSLSVRRTYVIEATAYAHVKVLPAVEVARHKLIGADISHNLWFLEEPTFNHTYRLRWRGTVLRPAGPPVDLHGLGEVWLCQAKAITPDNETVEVME